MRGFTLLPCFRLICPSTKSINDRYGYAKLDAYLVVNNDPATFCMYFFAWFSAYKNGAEYALRFNDDDLTHKIGWTLYGFCCMGMLIHTSGSIGGYNSSNFSFALFCCHVLVAIGQFRAALGIPAARFSATWKCVTLLTTACLWLVASVQLDRNRSSHNEEVLDITARVAWVLSLVIEWASYSLFFAWRGGRDMVKVSEECRCGALSLGYLLWWLVASTHPYYLHRRSSHCHMCSAPPQ